MTLHVQDKLAAAHKPSLGTRDHFDFEKAMDCPTATRRPSRPVKGGEEG